MMDGSSEKDARRALMHKMTQAATLGERTLVGVYATLSVLRTIDVPSLRSDFQDFIALEVRLVSSGWRPRLRGGIKFRVLNFPADRR